jgi:hypothetical protein
MAISRILSGPGKPRTPTIIHLNPTCARPPSDHSATVIDRHYSRRDATIPEDITDRLPFLCFVLHRMGFFLPRKLLRER